MSWLLITISSYPLNFLNVYLTESFTVDIVFMFLCLLVLTPNQTDVPDMDMAVGKELLTEAMLRNITPPLYERARAGKSDKAEPIKKKEKIQSTTKRVSKSKLAGEPESEVKFEATVPEEEEINGNKEDLDGVDVRGERTEIPLNGGDEENEEGRVDPDALKKKEGKRRCFPSKEKVGGGHCHKKHNKSSSEGKKRSSKEANIVSKKSLSVLMIYFLF